MKTKESKRLIEVRNWKKAVAAETRNLKGNKLLEYFNKASIKGDDKAKAA